MMLICVRPVRSNWPVIGTYKRLSCPIRLRSHRRLNYRRQRWRRKPRLSRLQGLCNANRQGRLLAHGAFTFACRMDLAAVTREQIMASLVSPFQAPAHRWNAIMMATLGFFAQICVRPLRLAAVQGRGPWRARARANPQRAFFRFFMTSVFPAA